jgi:CheY-like chemotaxis protein
MDCQMPSMDGFEATRKIRADERSRGLNRTPVVALTASALAEDSERCLGAGMDAHLPKPFREDQLLSVLLAHLPLVKASAPMMPMA